MLSASSNPQEEAASKLLLAVFQLAIEDFTGLAVWNPNFRSSFRYIYSIYSHSVYQESVTAFKTVCEAFEFKPERVQSLALKKRRERFKEEKDLKDFLIWFQQLGWGVARMTKHLQHYSVLFENHSLNWKEILEAVHRLELAHSKTLSVE